MKKIIILIYLAVIQIDVLKANEINPNDYINLSNEDFLNKITNERDQIPDAQKTREIARILLVENKIDLFKSGLDHWRFRQDFQFAVDQLGNSNLKDDLKLYMLKNPKYFFDYDDPGSRGMSGMQAKPYLYLYEKYLPGLIVDPEDFDYHARRKPLVDKLEAAMEEKRKPRELRRPDASDFEERSGNHVGKVEASESFSANARDFLKPVPIGIAAGIAAILALLGLRKIRKAQ